MKSLDVSEMTLKELGVEKRRLIHRLIKTEECTWTEAKRFHQVDCAIRYIKEQQDVASNQNAGKLTPPKP